MNFPIKHAPEDLENQPMGLLHTMLRVSNLEASLRFYVEGLGMRILRKASYSEGRFTNVFLGYGPEEQHTALEITFNWDEPAYEMGNRFGHLAIGVPDIEAFCDHLAEMGIVITRDPGPMKYKAEESETVDVIAFVKDPDGYAVEIIEKC